MALRRLTVRVKTGLGLAASGDDDIVAKRKIFNERLIPEADELGQGLSEHLSFLRGYYENGEKLGEVLASFLGGGEFDRSQEWALATGEQAVPETLEDKAVQTATRTAQERWAYLNNVARRSAAAILVKYSLDPLRKLTNETVPRVKTQLESYDATRVDAGGASSEKKKKQYNAQEDAEIRDATIAALEKCFQEFDTIVSDTACAIAACQAELCAATAEYLDEAYELLPPESASKFRTQMRDVIKIGGPALVSKQRTGARKAFELISGKKRFEDYKREKETQERKQQLQREQFEAAIVQENKISSSGRKPIKSVRATTLQQQRVDQSANTIKQVVALFDCSADEEGELSFSKGDVIEITDESDPDWLQGKLPDGTIGLLPSNYVQTAQAPRKSIRATPDLSQLAHQSTSKPKINTVIALFDNSADAQDELSFSKGDRITVLDDSDPDWYKGELLDGTIGLFPSNYVQAQAPRKSIRASTAIAQLAVLDEKQEALLPAKIAIALYDCSADEDGELSFSKDDRITILDDSDPEWLKGQLNDTIGLLPANYVTYS